MMTSEGHTVIETEVAQENGHPVIIETKTVYAPLPEKDLILVDTTCQLIK
jgi:hypothetical protein